MKIVLKKIIVFFTLVLYFSLTSCSGEVGNTKVNYEDFEYIPPVCEYRLINDNTAYELVSIEANYIGSFYVELTYNDPDNEYGTLPVTSIANNAFKDARGVFHIIILKNILTIGESAFDGWRGYQGIYFQISEEIKNTNKLYDFDPNWNLNSEAYVRWEAKPEDYGYTMDELMDYYNSYLENKDEFINKYLDELMKQRALLD